MRLILVARWFGRQLCRVGLHKWGRVREITGLQLGSASRAPNGDAQLNFWPTGHRFAIQCVRYGCRVEQQARRRWRDVGGHRVSRDAPTPRTTTRTPEPP